MRWGKVSLALSFLVLSILLASCAGHDQPLGGMLHRYDNTFPASVHSLLRDVVSFNKNDEANIVIIPSDDVRVSLRIWGQNPRKSCSLIGQPSIQASGAISCGLRLKTELTCSR